MLLISYEECGENCGTGWVKMIDITAQSYYRLGVKSWEQKDYAKAAAYWKKTRQINFDHTYAARWYWRALDMVESGQARARK